MGPGFESQRDHKKATPKELLFLFPLGGVPKGSIREGSRKVCGNSGAETIPAGSQKSKSKELLIFHVIHENFTLGFRLYLLNTMIQDQICKHPL